MSRRDPSLVEEEPNEHVFVIGSGIAGLSACARLLERGQHPVLLSQGVAESELSSGAADLQPWTEDPDSLSLPGGAANWAREFLSSLECFAHPGAKGGGSRVVSSEGIVRTTDLPARGLLELQNFARAKIGVWDLRRQEWSASRLCPSMSESPWARAREVTFVPVAMPGLLSSDELDLPLPAFYRLFDREEHQRRFLHSLSELKNLGTVQAMLCGPWLGSGFELFSQDQALPFGETLSPPEGPFGSRFAQSRAHFLIEKGIVHRQERVHSLVQVEAGVELESESLKGERYKHKGRGCVVATGGLVGGGVALFADRSGTALRGQFFEPAGIPGGARDGWDPAADYGAWIRAPHEEVGEKSKGGEAAHLRRSFAAPAATILGSVISGMLAADRIPALSDE